jgi:putative transposase
LFNWKALGGKIRLKTLYGSFFGVKKGLCLSMRLGYSAVVPRANRYILPGHIYHLTHRCHDRSFLLKFARDRNGYRRRLLETIRKHRFSLLTYCLTSNHVHLVIWAEDPTTISCAMQEVAGEFARDFNRRKGRSGACWEGRYQVTLVEGGTYLEHCMVYADLNMVRCGVVKHPGEWEWCGYSELMGRRRRNRLLDRGRVLELMGGVDLEDFRRHYEFLVEERIAKDQMKREPRWTESLGVGSEPFVRGLEPQIRNRRQVEVEPDGEAIWVLRETVPGISYGSVFEPEK